MNLPADDYILLSLVNTKLRDLYPTLEELCEEEEIEKAELLSRLSSVGYEYNAVKNAFVPSDK